MNSSNYINCDSCFNKFKIKGLKLHQNHCMMIKFNKKVDLIKSMSIGFYAYLNNFISILQLIQLTDIELQYTYDRYINLSNALKEKKLSLRYDSYLCSEYIVMDNGHIPDIANDMEEMSFLFNHTNYKSLSNKLINDSKKNQYEFNGCISKDICRTTAKMQICITYLSNSTYSGTETKGFNTDHESLPIKWIMCKPRFDEVISAQIDPYIEYASEYIYFNDTDMNSVVHKHHKQVNFHLKRAKKSMLKH